MILAQGDLVLSWKIIQIVDRRHSCLFTGGWQLPQKSTVRCPGLGFSGWLDGPKPWGRNVWQIQAFFSTEPSSPVVMRDTNPHMFGEIPMSCDSVHSKWFKIWLWLSHTKPPHKLQVICRWDPIGSCKNHNQSAFFVKYGFCCWTAKKNKTH